MALRLGGTLLPDRDETARALASAGLAGLVCLPLLIIASLALSAPLAGPALIALGYLGCAHAMAEEEQPRAALWAAAVFGGLIVWTIVMGTRPGSGMGWPEFLAASFAPVMAIAPALARRAFSWSSRAEAEVSDQVACLDRFAPAEALMFVDREGSIVAATRAVLVRLGLSQGSGGRDIAARIHVLDRPVFAGALARSMASRESIEIGVRVSDTDGEFSTVAATVQASDSRTAVVKLGDAMSEAVAAGGAGKERGTAPPRQSLAEYHPALRCRRGDRCCSPRHS